MIRHFTRPKTIPKMKPNFAFSTIWRFSKNATRILLIILDNIFKNCKFIQILLKKQYFQFKRILKNSVVRNFLLFIKFVSQEIYLFLFTKQIMDCRSSYVFRKTILLLFFNSKSKKKTIFWIIKWPCIFFVILF